jgi:hypothetical protein
MGDAGDRRTSTAIRHHRALATILTMGTVVFRLVARPLPGSGPDPASGWKRLGGAIPRGWVRPRQVMAQLRGVHGIEPGLRAVLLRFVVTDLVETVPLMSAGRVPFAVRRCACRSTDGGTGHLQDGTPGHPTKAHPRGHRQGVQAGDEQRQLRRRCAEIRIAQLGRSGEEDQGV